MPTTNTTKELIQEEPRGPSQLIELAVSSNGLNRISFPDIDNLKNDVDQNVVIKGLRLITPDVLVGPMLLSGTNAPLSELQKCALVLYSDGWEKAEYIPLLTMNDVATPAGTFPYRFSATKFDDWRKVNWTKSYIQFANGQVSAGAPYVIMFDCEYQKFNANNEVINGVS